jgi:starvation-inducible outer membrane lipoprotein
MRLLLVLMMFGLASCRTTPATIETRVACESFGLLKMSKTDTEGTQLQVRAHNRVYRVMCLGDK